jgi:hypothetical protein
MSAKSVHPTSQQLANEQELFEVERIIQRGRADN